MLPLFGHADIDERQRFCNSGLLGPPGTLDGFIDPLDTSWVFYRDMAMRDEIGNATYRPS
jgi:hypothetical protein